MPECHKCPVRPAPGTPWEDTPCRTCKLADPSHHGKTFISIDAVRPGAVDQSLPEVLATLHDARGPIAFHPVDKIEPPEQASTEPPEVTRAFEMAAVLFARFARLPVQVRERVLAAIREPGIEGRALADNERVSPQAISAGFRKAVEDIPELREVLPMQQKVGKETAEPIERDRPPPPEDPDAGAFVD